MAQKKIAKAKQQKVKEPLGSAENPIILDDAPVIRVDQKSAERTRNMVTFALKKLNQKRSTQRAEDMRRIQKRPNSQLWSEEENAIFKKCFIAGNKWLNSHARGKPRYTFDASKFGKLMKEFNYKNFHKAVRKIPRDSHS